MTRDRDSQRSAVYKWEREVWRRHTGARGHPFRQEMSIEECAALVRRVWASERGRYGRPAEDAPEVVWGRGCNATRTRIKLARFGRNTWVVMHEMAHSMIQAPAAAHGPRFVGCLIGMVSRLVDGFDGQAAIDLAAEMGVDVDIRSVGAIPVLREPTLAGRILPHLPGRITQLAWRAGCRRAQVRGAALTLIRNGHARYYRGRLVPLAA